ncbi:hypothetical protein H257_07290 [Aphanomyces astaci]|uniref:DUF659 domain-containing protein n=1 Tax=Aphanomyces astaci TaxID=112090 RepID=W4GJX6_APHAT|nr:hypothetical protein H257_07290 [Aphanomyces astaci]ETV79223.1 hypothetical protein H257_07290 [Aphanomyces astaci]|eukprot:XP_009831064.1 hypothetical protein H257_07290 [Aphanomyces astaci]
MIFLSPPPPSTPPIPHAMIFLPPFVLNPTTPSPTRRARADWTAPIRHMGLVYGRQLPPANQLGNVLTLRHNVFYYKKSKQSSHHLNKCEKFRSTMMALDPHERPTWFAVSTKRQKKAKALSSMKAPTGISFGHPSAAPVKTLQESMRRYALPKLSQVDLEAIKKYFAMHFYITSTLFHRVGQFHLKRAFQRARPDIVLPNRQALANKYLDICYHEVKQEKDRRLGAPDTQVCLTTDGWSDVNMEPVVNYMAANATMSVFLDSKYTEAQAHTAEWIAKDLEDTMAALPANVCGACTDNTAENP